MNKSNLLKSTKSTSRKATFIGENKMSFKHKIWFYCWLFVDKLERRLKKIVKEQQEEKARKLYEKERENKWNQIEERIIALRNLEEVSKNGK